jgi:hypothetical protein
MNYLCDVDVSSVHVNVDHDLIVVATFDVSVSSQMKLRFIAVDQMLCGVHLSLCLSIVLLATRAAAAPKRDERERERDTYMPMLMHHTVVADY